MARHNKVLVKITKRRSIIGVICIQFHILQSFLLLEKNADIRSKWERCELLKMLLLLSRESSCVLLA